MKKYIMNSLGLLIVFTVLLGLIYPLFTALTAQVLFPWQANGSLLMKGKEPIGSALIGQNFTGDRYFHGRPSAAGPNGYDAAASAGSNLGPTNKVLLQEVDKRAVVIRQENSLPAGALVPGDLATTSASGLDPHISVAAAQIQIKRVAKVRNMDIGVVQSLVKKYTRGPQLGILGEARVNVLELNLALDTYK